jgi:hypothetical protein
MFHHVVWQLPAYFVYSRTREVNNNKERFVEISGSHGSKYEDDYLLGCSTM